MYFLHNPSSTPSCSNSSSRSRSSAPARPASHVAQVQVRFLYPPVGRDLLGLVALHVLLHGGQAGAVLGADGALVGRGAVVRPQVLDHGRVVPGALVAQLALEGLLTCGRRERCEGLPWGAQGPRPPGHTSSTVDAPGMVALVTPGS